jgi:hypothetical protein
VLRDEIADLEQLRDKLKGEAAEAATEFHRLRQQKEQLEQELTVARAALDAVDLQRDQAIQAIESEVAAKRRAEEQALEQAQHALEAERQQAADAHRRELARLAQELEATRQVHLEQKCRLKNQFERLCDEVRGKADILRGLELIEQTQYDELLGAIHADHRVGDERNDWPALSDLAEGQAGVVPRVQRYLFAQDIVYPRDLLHSFHALLLTGDLIVLAGLSGAGKTMLVKAFADATDNRAHIIPVKPNWTSAEDLTGYYNPLQQGYLTTPFLDALIAARRDPDRLHLICLDEMNLARVEYYFADFLSALETRDTGKQPVIDLYADDEAGHVRAEVKLFVDLLLDLRGDKPLTSLGDFLRDGEIARQLRERLGLDDGEPLLKLHARLRRMLAGVLNVPSRLEIPRNVRFIGTVNMDATTHYLSPKVLDRAHVLQFQSPLTYWEQVRNEVGKQQGANTGVRIPASEFPRKPYPRFDPSDQTDSLTQTLNHWRAEFLDPMGIDLGLRVMRQSLAFRDALLAVLPSKHSQSEKDRLLLNLLLRQKILPRFFFDGKQPARNSNKRIDELVDAFAKEVREKAMAGSLFNAGDELRELIARARASDGMFNYWA